MWTVAGLTADLAAGRTSSRELVEKSLARIADAGGEGPRAFLKVYAETARAEADLADRLRAGGIVRSPVDGLPVSVKDLFDVGGDVTRAGSKLLADAPPAARDAPPVARLRAAGAPIVGRTNMVEFAFGTTGLNPHHGAPRHPRGAARGGEGVGDTRFADVAARGVGADADPEHGDAEIAGPLDLLGRPLRDLRRQVGQPIDLHEIPELARGIITGRIDVY